MFDRSDKLWSIGRCLCHQLVQPLPTSWRDVWQKWQTLVHGAVSLPSAGTTIAYLLKRCLTAMTNSGPWGGVSAISWYNHCLPLEEMFDRSDKLWSMGRCLCHQLVNSLPAVVDPLALIAVQHLQNFLILNKEKLWRFHKIPLSFAPPQEPCKNFSLECKKSNMIFAKGMIRKLLHRPEVCHLGSRISLRTKVEVWLQGNDRLNLLHWKVPLDFRPDKLRAEVMSCQWNISAQTWELLEPNFEISCIFFECGRSNLKTDERC